MRGSIVAVFVLASGCGTSVDVGAPGSTSGSGGAGGAGAATGGGSTWCEPGYEEPCYDGPDGTEGIGVCTGGTRKCRSDGKGFEACLGQVLPSAEDCTTTGDDDCDGTPCPAQGVWSKALGEPNASAMGFAVAVDPTDNVLLAGTYGYGPVDLGGGPLANLGMNDVFVAKFSPAGVHQWSRALRGPEVQGVFDVAANAQSVVVVGVSHSGTLDLGSGPMMPPAGIYHAFVVKLDAAGNYAWGKLIGGATGMIAFERVMVAPNGSVIIAGGVEGTVVVDDVPLQNPGLHHDPCVLTFDPAGNLQWVKQFGGDDAPTDLRALALDANGDIVVAGASYGGTIDFGAGPVPAPGPHDLWITKLDASGSLLWSERYPGGPVDEIDVAIHQTAGIVLAGAYDGQLALGPQPLTGVDDVFIAKLDASGQHLWSAGFGAPSISAQRAISVAVDPNGNTRAYGFFSDVLDFGGGPMTAGIQDIEIFLAKRDPSGAHLWAKEYASSLEYVLNPRDIACDSGGNTIMTGSFQGTIDFGSGPITSTSGENLFLAKVGP